ncbi:hypothetical protein IKE82_01500 [Candidatus Saccharibacteria bacterium]|nr:hypothetical protein [Candidatus Saccharibacteria bacterium]
MEETNRKEFGYLIGIFIVVQIIFFVVIGAIIINVANHNDKITNIDSQPKITVEGLSSNELSLRDSVINDISHDLTSMIEQNTANLDLHSANAIIREGSIAKKEFAQRGFTALSFIVDIPSLEQSYQVYYKYPTNAANEQTTENPSATLCLEDEAQIIHPNFNCRSSYSEDIRKRIATDYIKFMEFDDFSITLDDSDPTRININPITDVSDDVNESYISQVKASIQALGVSPDIFKYHVVKKADLNYLNPY